MGYKKQEIAAISQAIEELQDAIMNLEEGEMKSKLMEAVMPVQEMASELEPREISPEDEMMEMEDEDEGMDLGEPKPFQPEKASKKAKSPFGAMTEEE